MTDSTNEGQNIEGDSADAEESGSEAPSNEERNSEEKDRSGDDIDYQAQLKKERERLEQAEHNIVQEKKKRKELEEKLDDDEANSDSSGETSVDDLDESTIRSMIQEEVNEVRQEAASSTVDDVLSSVSSSEDERELIRHHYENTINQSGYSREDVQRDIRRAKLLANESNLETQLQETAQALQSERSKKKVGGMSPQRSGSDDARANVSLTSDEEKLAERRAKRSDDLSLEEARQRLMDAKAGQ